MVHLDKPGPDIGLFCTDEVQGRKSGGRSPEEWETSRTIALPRNHYNASPTIGVGINALNCSSNSNIRVQAKADNVSKSSFSVSLNTWNVSTINSGRVTWLEAKQGAKDCQIGSWVYGIPTSSPQNEKQISFQSAFNEPPEVVIWLNYFDHTRENPDNYWRIMAYATDVTRTGFMAHLDTWNGSQLYKAGLTWIAYPKGKKRVASGQFKPDEIEAKMGEQKKVQQVTFPKGKFKRPPTVLSALNMIDHTAEADLEVASVVEDVTAEGFTWKIESKKMWQANASYIALGFS